MVKMDTLFLTKMAKNGTLWAAHTCKAHIRQYSLLGVVHNVVYIFLKAGEEGRLIS